MRTTKKLYQWDTNQKLIDCVGKYVDYPIGDEVYRIEVIDKECIIPDELLQVSGTVKVYECMEYGTVKAFAFYINPRPMPPDYVFTPTQRLTFEGLVKKVDETIADLQKRAASGEFNGSDYVITESDYDAIAAKTAGKLQPTIGELARTLETEKTDRERADISLQKDISGKLSEPAEGLSVGKYFRVAQIDENGHAVLEAVDAKTIGVQDVQVNGDSIVNVENGVADLPIANSQNVLGLMKVGSVVNGIGITADGSLAIDGAINTYIDNRQSTRPITPINLDYAVKTAMCDGKGAAWTAEEQAAARERMGIPGDYELIERFTMTEAGTFDRNSELDGTPYNFKKLLVYRTYPDTVDVSEASGWSQLYFFNSKGKHIRSECGIPSKALSSNFSFFENDHNISIVKYSRTYGDSTGITYLCSKPKKGDGWDIGFGNCVRVVAPSSDIEPTGTIVEIYGVRA